MRPDIDLMTRDSNGESVVQMSLRLCREAEASRAAGEGVTIDTRGPELVLEFLRRKVELERAMNAGKIRE